MNDSITSATRIQPDDCDLFVGMDVDQRSIALTWVNRLGIEKSLKMPHDAEVLLGWLRNQQVGRGVGLVYEAGPTGFGLCDALTRSGYTCLVVSPSSVPTARGKRVRTNRLDSRKLALQLRGGGLEGIRVPSERYRQLRELVHLRRIQIGEVAKAKQRIKALFLRNGLSFPRVTVGGYWPQALICELRQMECPGALGYKLGCLLDSLEFFRYQAASTQMAIRQMVESDDELSDSVRLAMSIPGIGWIVASYAVARIGDWRLLKSSNEMSSFFGLVPSEDSTGEEPDRGSITKTGDPSLRSMLIEGAWMAIRKDAELAEFYKRTYSTHPRHLAARVAIVAVARKLAARLHCVLKERREYQVRAKARA